MNTIDTVAYMATAESVELAIRNATENIYSGWVCSRGSQITSEVISELWFFDHHYGLQSILESVSP